MNIHNNKDLEKCTKAELIEYVEETHWLRPFKYSLILFNRWQVKVEELRIKRELNTLPSTEEAKAQDALAIKFNAETNMHKRISIIEEMKPYQKKMDIWIKTNDRINKEELDKLYSSISIQRERES